MTREQKLKLIWRYTHRDYRGIRNDEDRTKVVLEFVPGVGTCSVPLDSLTDEQIEKRMPFVLKCEEVLAERRAALKAGTAITPSEMEQVAPMPRDG